MSHAQPPYNCYTSLKTFIQVNIMGVRHGMQIHTCTQFTAFLLVLLLDLQGTLVIPILLLPDQQNLPIVFQSLKILIFQYKSVYCCQTLLKKCYCFFLMNHMRSSKIVNSLNSSKYRLHTVKNRSIWASKKVHC
jgi:hypothetical protein